MAVPPEYTRVEFAPSMAMSPVKVLLLLVRLTTAPLLMVRPTVPVATVPVIMPSTAIVEVDPPPGPLRVRAFAPSVRGAATLSVPPAACVQACAPPNVSAPVPAVPLIVLVPVVLVATMPAVPSVSVFAPLAIV